MIIGVFEVHNTIGISKANQVRIFLDYFALLNKVICLCKNESFDLRTLTNALTNVDFYFFLDLPSPFVRSCFGHAMSKATQYVIDDAKMFVGFLKLSLKGV